MRLFAPIIICLLTTCVAGPACAQSADDWVAVAERTLEQTLSERYPLVAEWSLQPVLGKRQAWTQADVPDRVDSEVTRIGSRSVVLLKWQQDGRPTQARVWFAVAGSQKVLIAKSDIAAWQALDPTSFEVSEQDVIAMACAPLQAPEEIQGMRTRRTMHAGQPVCMSHVEMLPPVARGQQVTVRSSAGGVTVLAKAIAQRDGKLGDVLQVKSPSSGEMYPAAVSGVGEVVVHE